MEAGPEPCRLRACTAAIGRHAQQKQLAKALAEFDRLVRDGFKPTVHVFAALMNAHVACGDLQGALAVHERLLQAGIAPNVVVLTTLLKGHVNVGDVAGAMKLFRQACSPSSQSGGRAVRPDVRAVNTLLRGCVRTGEMRTAVRLFRRMRDEWHLEPDVSTYKCVAKLRAMCADEVGLEAIVDRLDGGERAANKADARACRFWAEGKGTCPRGAQCRFYHAPEIVQLGTGSAVDAQSAPRAALLAEVWFALAHARAVLHNFAGALDALARAEHWHSAWREEGRDATSAEGEAAGLVDEEDDMHWYSALAAKELRQEINRLRTFALSAQSRGPASSPPPLREFLRHVFLFRARVLRSAREAPSHGRRAGDALAQGLFDALAEAFGLATACLVDGGVDAREGLGSFAEEYARCIGGRFGRLRLHRVFGGRRLPTHLEIASGNGDWVVAQARATAGTVNWIACELRFDRVFRTLSQMVTARQAHICLLGGNATAIVADHLPEESVHRAFINFPEPPHHSGNAASESVLELLSEAFFVSLGRVLRRAPPGRLTILSDSQPYMRTLAARLASLPANGPSFASTPANGAGSRGMMTEDVQGIRIHCGVPGPEQGHAIRAQSYFDRFWAQGHHVERYFVEVMRTS